MKYYICYYQLIEYLIFIIFAHINIINFIFFNYFFNIIIKFFLTNYIHHLEEF
jgi:hypothetical protein